MNIGKAVALALLLMPAIADAQRGGRQRGIPNADWKGMDETSADAPKFGKRDIQRFSGVKVVMDRRKDVRLSEDQFNLFKALDLKVESKNDGLFRVMDSLRLATRMRPNNNKNADFVNQERARTSIAKQELMGVIEQIRANYDTTFTECLALLDETQRTSAGGLVEKEQTKAEEDLRERLAGGRAGPPASGGARRPGRPQQ